MPDRKLPDNYQHEAGVQIAYPEYWNNVEKTCDDVVLLFPDNQSNILVGNRN
jgi:hypothetical protein